MKESREFVCLFSAIGIFGWLLLAPLFVNSNVIIYFGGIAIFMAFYFGQFLLKKSKYYNTIVSSISSKIGYVIVFLFFAWAVCSYIYEYEYDSFQVKNYARHQVPVYIYFVLLITITHFSIKLIYSLGDSCAYSKVIRVTVSCCVIYLQGAFLYNPNFFSGSEANMNLLHIDAYTTSIINASKGVPYSDTMNSIYGRYGIFYVIPVKIINLFVHNKWIAVTMAVALVGMITYGIICYLLNALVKNNFIFFLAVMASCVPGFQMIGHHSYEVYYQGFPHRIFAQMLSLLCCYIAIKNKEKNSKFIRLICWGLMSICILWSLEIGLIGLIIWLICDAYLSSRTAGWTVSLVIKEIVFTLCTVGGSYAVLFIYNFVCGQRYTPLRVFLYPFVKNTTLEGVDNESIFQSLSDSLYTRQYKGAFEGGFIFVIIFLSIICTLIFKYFKRQMTDKELFILTLSGLGLECYFYHVSHDNFFTNFIVVIVAVLVIAILSDYFARNKDEKNMVLYIMTTILVIFCLASLSSLPGKYSRVEKSIWITEEAERFANEMIYSIPDDTLCIGEGMPQICAYTGYDPKATISDFPDFPVEASIYLEGIINEKMYGHILVSKCNEQYITSDYVLIREFEYPYNSAYSYMYYELEEKK